MQSEWLKIMLEEIARKQAAAIEAQREEERRRLEAPATPSPKAARAAG